MDASSGTGASEESAESLVVELLPARHGDAILVTWGSPGDRHRLLVDGGPASAYDEVRARLSQVAAEGPLDLLVLTHIDADHIEGTILLTNDAGLDLDIGEVWYNGAPQLADYLAPAHGEILGRILAHRELNWNSSFDHGAVCAGEGGTFPVRERPGGLRLTVLGPDPASLRRLAGNWSQTWREAGLEMGSVPDALAALQARRRLVPRESFLSRPAPLDVGALARSRAGKDRSIANRSSIVLLAEYAGCRVLLAGDVTPDQLGDCVRNYLGEDRPPALPLTAFKVPHHGSAKNITSELVELLPADRYLFSSDGSHYDHPEDAAVATVVTNAPAGAELVFNYRNPRTLKWQDDELRDAYGYRVRYPDGDTGGIRVVLR